MRQPETPNRANFWGIQPYTFTLQIHQSLQLLHFFVFICQFIHSMTHTKYQKYVFGLKSSHLKIGANGAGAYTIPRSVSYAVILDPSLACDAMYLFLVWFCSAHPFIVLLSWKHGLFASSVPLFWKCSSSLPWHLVFSAVHHCAVLHCSAPVERRSY